MVSIREPSKNTGWVSLVTATVLLALPYALAASTGTPAADAATALPGIHSRAASIFCQSGLNPTGAIFMVETVIFFFLALLAQRYGSRFGTLGAALQKDGMMIAALLALVCLPFFTAWQTDSSVCERGKAYFWESIFIDVFILAILSISYNLLFGFTGIVSFGHAAFFGLGAYMVGIFIKFMGWNWWQAVLATLLVGILVALVKGVVGLRIRGLYFALFTLAFAEVFYLLAGNRLLVDITGAEDGFTFEVPDFLNTVKNRLFFYYLTLVVLVIAFLLVRRLMRSPTGQVLVALRDNEDRAQMLGFNTFYYKLVALALSGLLATGAGILRGLAAKGASPNVLGVGFTFDPLLATIIGGAGTFVGPVLGTGLMHLLEQSLRDTIFTIGSTEVNIGEHWALILGVTFIVIVLAFPRGIVGSLQSWWQRWRARQVK